MSDSVAHAHRAGIVLYRSLSSFNVEVFALDTPGNGQPLYQAAVRK